MSVRLAAGLIATTALVACTSVSADQGSTPPAPAGEQVVEVDEDLTGEPTEDVADARLDAMRSRCLDTATVMERRLDSEDLDDIEADDDAFEVDEDELESVLTPAPAIVDGVAAPSERPDLSPMGAYDAETAPILELDHLVWTCVEIGIVTESDLGFDDDEDPAD